jgi:O-6-methylguanine DNA methyltransferase
MPRKEEATPFLMIGKKEHQTLCPRTFFIDPQKCLSGNLGRLTLLAFPFFHVSHKKMLEYFSKTSLGTLRLHIDRAGIQRMDFVERVAVEIHSLHKIFEELSNTGQILLRPKGSVFQGLVWSRMFKIPCGDIANYSDLAQDLDKPRANQAVGRAVAANPIAILLPCHRVLPVVGGLGGFRWGVARKKQFLEWEASGADILEELCGLQSVSFQFCLQTMECTGKKSLVD